MKVFSEIKIPCEYMTDQCTEDWLKQRIADKIAQELLNQDFIKFEEKYINGYYVMDGFVEVNV